MLRSPFAVRLLNIAALTILLSMIPYPGLAQNGKVNINMAAVEELTVLEGIGEVLAGRIVAFRQKHGFFKDIADIKEIRGIGDKKFERIKDKISLGDVEGAH